MREGVPSTAPAHKVDVRGVAPQCRKVAQVPHLRTEVDVKRFMLDVGMWTKSRACAQKLTNRPWQFKWQCGPSTAPAHKKYTQKPSKKMLSDHVFLVYIRARIAYGVNLAAHIYIYIYAYIYIHMYIFMQCMTRCVCVTKCTWTWLRVGFHEQDTHQKRPHAPLCIEFYKGLRDIP